MKSKTMMIGIAILAVGLIALPQTLALFAGQHDWYALSDSSADNFGVPCQKCHADIFAELNNSGIHGPNSVVGSGETCATCHIDTFGNRADGTVGGNPAIAVIHAAGRPSCLDDACHGVGGVLVATSILNASSVEAHVPFATEAMNSQLLIDNNEACIACHTHVAVDINWQKAYKMSFNAKEFANQTVHTWIVDNFITEGTVDVQTYGNRSGEITGTTPEVVTISPVPPGYDPAHP